MYKGISAFAAFNPKFNFNKFLDQYPDEVKKPAISVLAGFFAKKDNWDKLVPFLGRFAGRPTLLQVHAYFHSSHKQVPSKEYLEDFACGLDSFLDSLPDELKLKVAVDPILEDKVKDKDWKKCARIINKCMNNKVIMVRCSLNNGAAGGKKEEKHGSNPPFSRPSKRRIYNPDGTSIILPGGNSDFKRKMTPAKFISNIKKHKPWAVFSWHHEQQGLQNIDNSASAPPPSQRKYVFTPEARDFNRGWLR